MAEFLEELAGSLGVAVLTEDEVQPLLKAAREVAHRVERKATPLSTYLVGVAVGQLATPGTDRRAALSQALDAVLGLLPDAPQ